MTPATVSAIMQNAIMVVLKCSMPMMLAALLIGVIVSIFQAATQINEQTLAFVPKIVGVFLALLVCTGFIVTELTEFFRWMYQYVAQLGQMG